MSTGTSEDKQFKWVGTRQTRPDGTDKVTGRAKYGADHNVANMLHGKVLRSPACTRENPVNRHVESGSPAGRQIRRHISRLQAHVDRYGPERRNADQLSRIRP